QLVRQRREELVLQLRHALGGGPRFALALEDALALELDRLAIRDVLHGSAQPDDASHAIAHDFAARRDPDALAAPEGLELEAVPLAGAHRLDDRGLQHLPLLVRVEGAVLVLEIRDRLANGDTEDAA